MIASRSGWENFCGGIAEPGVTAAGVRKCSLSHSGERRAPTLSSSGPVNTANAAEFVAAAAPAVLEHLLASGQFRRSGIVRGLVTFATRRLDVFLAAAWVVPVRHVAVGVRSGRGTALALMADGATEFLKRMLVVNRMVGQGLRVAAVARVFHRQMAARAAIHAVEFREDDLADFESDSFGQRTLLRAWRRAGFPL